MTDWYVTLPYATGLVRVENGKVTMTPPIFRWMLGMQWLICKDLIARKGGHGEPLGDPGGSSTDRAAER